MAIACCECMPMCVCHMSIFVPSKLALVFLYCMSHSHFHPTPSTVSNTPSHLPDHTPITLAGTDYAGTLRVWDIRATKVPLANSEVHDGKVSVCVYMHMYVCVCCFLMHPVLMLSHAAAPYPY